jgi:hypothetical protein
MLLDIPRALPFCLGLYLAPPWLGQPVPAVA